MLYPSAVAWFFALCIYAGSWQCCWELKWASWRRSCRSSWGKSCTRVSRIHQSIRVESGWLISPYSSKTGKTTEEVHPQTTSGGVIYHYMISEQYGLSSALSSAVAWLLPCAYAGSCWVPFRNETLAEHVLTLLCALCQSPSCCS
jgi:hypothetical protein